MPTEAPTISFGPFSVLSSERLLKKGGQPIEISARAYDILVILLSQPNEVISKKDLLARAWPDVTVDEGSLRFHMAGLRKALGDGKDGARYITTIPGRGYCFVAPVSRTTTRRHDTPIAAVNFPHANLPSHPGRIVGRDDEVLKVTELLLASRFVSVVGAGGVGKTTVAIAVGHHLAKAFANAVLFIDLSMLSDPKLVATAIASTLALSVQSDDAAPGLIAYLRDKRILLILDTCEHLIDRIAALAARIFVAAPQVHILATSREPLQVEDEHILQLDPLACPPDTPTLTAAIAQTYPATQLFLERAAASDAHLGFSDMEAAVAAGICRRLDGVALAIELAARRVGTHGLLQIAELLDQRLGLLWSGLRTAPPRQKTLRATLDWSYELLSEQERRVLRRLAIFVGDFSIEASLEIATSADLPRSIVAPAIDSLLAKSMVTTRPVGTTMCYRLLDTTRAYALEIEIDQAERTGLATRHANYYLRWLNETGTEWATLPTGSERAPYFAALNNGRAALEWCFGVDGNTEIGISLAAAAAPVFLALSLLPECHRWSQQALLVFSEAARGGHDEMRLQAALGLSLIFTRGESETARVAVSRALAIAEDRGDVLDQLRLLGLLHMFHHRIGDFRAAFSYATRSTRVAATVKDPTAVAAAHCILGVTLHHMGDFGAAGVELDSAREHRPGPQRTGKIYLGLDHRSWAGGTLARNLWLQGHPTLAAQLAYESVNEATRAVRPTALSIALNCAITVFFWRGDLESAEEHIDWLMSHSESHSLATFLAVGRGFRGELAIHRGDLERGIETLQGCLRELHTFRYMLLASSFSISLAEGLAESGRFAEGIALLDERIKLDEADRALSYVPELLRLKGRILQSMPERRIDDAETCFWSSLDLSRSQGARAWQLRAATDLAKLLADHGRSKDGRTLLQPICAGFSEGFETTDLKSAEELLATLK